MPLRTCQVCERRYIDDRADCPYCGALSASLVLPKSLFGGGREVPRRWVDKAVFALVVLVTLNVWRAATRDLGPDPEVEALHSEDEAVRVCREAVESRWAARDLSIVGPGRPEYLQGGEYEVWLAVEFQDGTLRARDEVVCEVQFTPDTGWIVEDVSPDLN